RSIGDRYSLKEKRNARGEFDCIFLEEQKVPGRGSKGKAVFSRRVCSIYTHRPLQCRTWPFWDGILQNRAIWDQTGERCHGINQGKRTFSAEQTEALRDARDGPKAPPTSAPDKP